jgi:hypothetical protein
VIGAVGGAGVTALFKSEDLFSGYCIGLAIGFVAYLIIALVIGGRTDLNKWMGSS